MATFDITRISLNITGTQTFTADAQVTTRADRTPADMIAVTVGTLLIQVHDLAAARAFATACRTATGYLPSTLPQKANLSETDCAKTPGVLLRVEGTPPIYRINGFGAAYGNPHVRIHLDRLAIRFFDLDALLSWVAGWEDVERLAKRIWPEPDALERAEGRERARIARHGSAALAATTG